MSALLTDEPATRQERQPAAASLLVDIHSGRDDCALVVASCGRGAELSRVQTDEPRQPIARTAEGYWVLGDAVYGLLGQTTLQHGIGLP